MAKLFIQDTTLTAIADAISELSGISADVDAVEEVKN